MSAPISDSSANRTEKYEWHKCDHVLVALKSTNRSSLPITPQNCAQIWHPWWCGAGLWTLGCYKALQAIAVEKGGKMRDSQSNLLCTISALDSSYMESLRWPEEGGGEETESPEGNLTLVNRPISGVYGKVHIWKRMAIWYVHKGNWRAYSGEVYTVIWHSSDVQVLITAINFGLTRFESPNAFPHRSGSAIFCGAFSWSCR